MGAHHPESASRRPIELWGGVECTVNRVRERFHDQLARTGHLTRTSDIDRFAELGITALRVPILWERCVEEEHGPACYRDLEAMLERVRARGLRAIAGLVHHGSGPRFTQLLDPGFEDKLALYAADVAQRFPWIEDFTPVNEPLTTARFSALYGHWYPHARSTPELVRALLHETRATIKAMAAIRRIHPRARLVQTEDIATVTSTPLLAYQAAHENERRWLSLDLLCGRVDRHHPLYDFLVAHGASEGELAWIADHVCVPDLVGANYYLTSDRHLDEDLERYPVWSHGGNGRHCYADVHASMVPGVGLSGHRALLEAVWERYHLPVVISEVHLGATREEQLRWFTEAWTAANEARESGVDVRAVTAWALLGSYDWNALVVEPRGFYESGVFDVRGTEPRRTALAEMIRQLSSTGHYDHPALDAPGFWHRVRPERAPRLRARPRPLLITGARGTLGRELALACEARGLAYQLVDRRKLDIANPDQVRSALSALQPWGVINAAGYVRVDDAEADEMRCMRENVAGPVVLAAACRRVGAQLLTFSSDLVFDGQRREPYVESHEVAPLSVYGRSKAEAERRVAERHAQSLIVRTSAFFGPTDPHNFVTRMAQSLEQGAPFHAPSDTFVSPTYVPHLVGACLDLLLDGASGLWHLANAGAVSWAELAIRAARVLGLSSELVVPCEFRSLGLAAVRPSYSVMHSERAVLMPSLEEGLEAYARERRAA